jgi:hypothetical protein
MVQGLPATYTSLRNSPICLTDSNGACVTTVRYRFAVDEWPWTKLFRPQRFELVFKKQGRTMRRLNLDNSLNLLQFQCYQDVRLKSEPSCVFKKPIYSTAYEIEKKCFGWQQ